MKKRLYDSDGRWIALDERHSIAREFHGAAKPGWAFRFCGEWIAVYATKTKAEKAALVWEMARVARLCP